MFSRIGRFRQSSTALRAFLFVILFSHASGSLHAGETINSALASAYSTNPTINAQRAATRAADEGVPIAKSGLRPSVTGDANYGVFTTDSNGVTFGTADNAFTLQPGGFGVTINQTLWDSFLTRNQVSSAQSGVQASQEVLRNIVQNILFNGASAYLDVRRDRAILVFLRRNLEFLEEQVRSEQARFDVGEATRTDVAQARASRADAQAQVSLAVANLRSSEATFRQIVGRDPGPLAPVKGVDRIVPGNIDKGLQIAYREHPAIKATEYLVDQAIFDVKAAESGLLPRVDLQANAQRNFEPGTTSTVSEQATVTATLQVPIYQGGAQRGVIRQNKETLGQRRIEVDESVNDVRAAVVSAYSQYDGARASVAANQEQLRAAQLALDGIIEERRVGQRTTLDVLQTQGILIDAQIALENSVRDFKAAGYAILSAVGRLSPQKLRLAVAVYDPKDHLKKVEDKWFGLRTPNGN